MNQRSHQEQQLDALSSHWMVGFIHQQHNNDTQSLHQHQSTKYMHKVFIMQEVDLLRKLIQEKQNSFLLIFTKL